MPERVLRAHRACASPICRQKADALPGVSPLTALPPFPRTRCDSRQTASQPERDSDGPGPVSSFVVGLCPAPPVAPKRAATALQRTLAERRRPLLLKPHSQSAAFEALRDRSPSTGYHSGSSRPSRVSDSCCASGHVGSRVLPLSRATRCTFRAPALSQFPDPCGLISGGRNQRLPRTRQRSRIARSAPSPNALTSKPLRASHG